MSIKPNVNDSDKTIRVKFFRNGDHLNAGKIITISKKRYSTLENLLDDLTRIFVTSSSTTSLLSTVYTTNGDIVTNLKSLKNGENYVCACKKEKFLQINLNNVTEPKKPKIQISDIAPNNIEIATCEMQTETFKENREFPRLIFLVKNGPKPRKILYLFLKEKNVQTFDTLIEAISNLIKFNTGCIQKIFNLKGKPVKEIKDFFDIDNIFFIYAKAYKKIPNNFELTRGEWRSIKRQQEKLSNIVDNKTSLPIASCNILPTINFPSIIARNYTIDCFIGKGGFGNVYKIIKHYSSMEYALKIVNKAKSKNARIEIEIMKRLKHENIVKFFESTEKFNKLFMILEFIRGGSLLKIVRKIHLPEHKTRLIMKELCEALSYIHSKHIIHRDVKVSNILAECDRSTGEIISIKLTDFGAACKIATSSQQRYYGTPSFTAPEVLKGFGYGAKIDVWAAGLVLFILLTRKSAFPRKLFQTKVDMFAAITMGKYSFPKQLESKIPESVKDLLKNMLQVDHKERYSSAAVLKHPWINGKNS